MPIAALPQETIRLLGSPLVYSSPVAVVKELVDNAIDARATSVEVFISANCVDSIEVRDNGQGIHSDDFAALGHRGCTSKLRNFEDIQTVGGVTLGFRGDALASASTLSTLQIVTRTAGESTAAKLYLSANGGVAKIERVAAPVGTAVKVTDLFAKIPARKQWALKEAAKTIPKIKELLHSYAFAKPHVKLIFRVHEQLKAAWSYAPGSHPTIKQAALQVFGAELVSQCVEKTNRRVQDMTKSPSDNLAAIFKVQGEGNYIINALLPQPGADPTKISKGAWFSVDARPVSSSKGTIKILYSAFKACLSRTLASDGSTITSKSPFLVVNIECPPKSYDPNIEPSKDEVLFVNSHRLIEVFGRLLEDVYSHPVSKASIPQKHGSRLPSLGHTPVVSPPSPLISGSDASDSSRVPGLTSTSQAGTQQLSTRPRMTISGVNRREQALPYVSPPSSDEPRSRPIQDLHASSIYGSQDDRGAQISRGWRVDMSSLDEHEDGGIAITRQTHGRDEGVQRNFGSATTMPSQGLNPWVIAKSSAAASRGWDVVSQPTPQTRLTEDRTHATASQADSLVARPVREIPLVGRPDTERAFGKQVLAPIPATHLHAPGVLGGAYRSPISNPRVGDSDTAQGGQHQLGVRRGSQGSVAPGRHGERAYRKSEGSSCQYPSSQEQDNNWFQELPDFNTRKSNRLKRRRPGSSERSNIDQAGHPRLMMEEPDVNIELGATRRRQVLAENRRLRETMGGWLDSSADPGDTPAVIHSVEASRQGAQAQSDVLKDDAPVKTGLPPGDSRVHLTSKERSRSASKPRELQRVKSCMLPLESTPAGEETHNLMQTVQIDMQQLCRSFTMEQNHYVLDVTGENALDRYRSQSELSDIRRRVRELLSGLGFDDLESVCQAGFNGSAGRECESSADKSQMIGP